MLRLRGLALLAMAGFEMTPVGRFSPAPRSTFEDVTMASGRDFFGALRKKTRFTLPGELTVGYNF